MLQVKKVCFCRFIFPLFPSVCRSRSTHPGLLRRVTSTLKRSNPYDESYPTNMELPVAGVELSSK